MFHGKEQHKKGELFNYLHMMTEINHKNFEPTSNMQTIN